MAKVEARVVDRASPGIRQAAVGAVLRVGMTVTVVVLLYYLLPLENLQSAGNALLLAVGVGGAALVSVAGFRSILKAPYPGAKAMEVLALFVSLFLVVFAGIYFLIDKSSPGAFTQPMARTDSLYFAITTLSTVGYGDITARTDTARVVVMIQMVSDLLIVGVGVKVLVGAVQLSRQRNKSGRPA